MDAKAKKAAIAAAGILGVSTTAYLATRAKYRAGFKESANMAEDMAKNIKTESVKARQHTMVFTVGGMAYADESPETISGERLATTMKMALSRDKGKDFKLIPVNNADSNVPAERKRGSGLEQAVDAARIYYDRIAKNGRSPAAVNLAAHVIAWSDANPKAQVVMAGHSMGGYDVHEAQEILRIARPDLEGRLKSFAIGSRYLGLTNKFGESHTIGSPNDPETSRFPTRDLKSFSDVKGHSQGAYFASPEAKKFMADTIYRGVKVADPPAPAATPKKKGGSKKADADEISFDADPPTSMPSASSITPQNDGQRQFYTMLKVVIERVYQDRVDRIFNCKVSDGNTVSGWFQDGLKVFKFELGQKGLTYAPVRPGRGDSAQQVFALSLMPVLVFDSEAHEAIKIAHPGEFQVEDQIHLDSGKKKCTSPGAYNCGGACISGKRVCRVGGQNIASPGEISAIARVGRSIGLAQTGNQTPPQTPTQAATQASKAEPEDPYKDLSIRDLRDLAKGRVSRYSYMSKDQIKSALKAADESPEQQERLRKTLEKARTRREADPLRSYKSIQSLSFLWKNKKGVAAAISAGITVFGVTNEIYSRMRQRYRGGFYESANTAESRAQGIKVETVPRGVNNVTFCVDGFSYGDNENRGHQVETELKKADPNGFGKKHKLISVTGEEYTDLPGAGRIPQPVRGAVESLQAMNRQLFETQIRGRNPQAIELAAQMHAYSQAYGGSKPSPQRKNINVIAYHEGGHVVDEAMEIFHIIDPKAAGNVRVVKLGTPYFGLTNQIAKKGRVKRSGAEIKGRTITVTSPGDAFSVFPKMNPVQINTVKGNGLKDYLSDPRALDRIRSTFEVENHGKRRAPAPTKKIKSPTPKKVENPTPDDIPRTPPSEAPGSGGVINKVVIPPAPKTKPQKRNPSEPKSDANYYLDSFVSCFANEKEDAQEGGEFDAKKSLKGAIAQICPAIAQVLTIEHQGQGLTGKFVDIRRRVYRYSINGAKISYQEILPPGQRVDSIGPDQCKIGTPCKESCIERGTKCLGTLSEASQAIVKLVKQTLEKEELPSRGEILKTAGTVIRGAIKNPRQFIREGKEREEMVIKGLEFAEGKKLPDKTLMMASFLKKANDQIDTHVDKVVKTALEPENLKENAVATGGYVGSQVGAAVGGFPGQLAGDLAGAMATRKAINDYQRLKQAQSKLAEDEVFAKAGKLKKLAMVNGQMLSDMRDDKVKQKAGDDMTADISGWAIGNAYALTAANKAIPVPGAAAALAIVPAIVSARSKVKSGEGLKGVSTAFEERNKTLTAPIGAVRSGNAKEAEVRESAKKWIKAFKKSLFM
jgi:hypothetical protein